MLGFPYGMAFALIPMVCLDWFGMGVSFILILIVTNYLTVYENSSFLGKLGLHVRFAHHCIKCFCACVWA